MKVEITSKEWAKVDWGKYDPAVRILFHFWKSNECQYQKHGVPESGWQAEAMKHLSELKLIDIKDSR